MKKHFTFLMIITVMALFSCKKDKFDQVKALADENLAVQAYVNGGAGGTGFKDTLGLYYKILKPGTGEVATLGSTVILTYTAKLLDGTLIDQGASGTFLLQNVIQGWQIGVPLIKPGGEITLVVPSPLAYGTFNPKINIPGNSALVFDITFIGYKQTPKS